VKQLKRISRYRGISLIEILVTVIILAFGLLGLAGLQAFSLQGNNSAFFRTQATYFAYDIMDRMRANRNEALAGSYDVGVSDATPTDRGTRINEDLSLWRTSLATLPSGTGGISTVSAASTYTVEIQWSDTRKVNDDDELIMQTFIATGRL
jgi:type IV pilus assembly protein PilV